jgi:hypothetical protein
MFNRRTACLAVALAVTMPCAAIASTIITPAIPAFGLNKLACSVTNASDEPIEPLIELIGTTGMVLASGAPAIQPGGALGVATAAGVGLGSCRVTGVRKSKVRVALCVVDTATNCLAAVTP